MTEQAFFLRPIPRRLMRSLLSFAGAGTLMAAAVSTDAGTHRLVPALMLAACWGIPLLFWWQIRRQGFDPLERLVATDLGLEAHFRAESVRFIPWHGMRRLLRIEGFRHQARAIITDELPLRWFGELEAPETFEQLVVERTGLEWELAASVPDDGAAG